ncbi:malate dehydrogenase [Segniliparus rotundus DSM 44985]|uniref:Malate dehydrogenase n=1 Tax=Segniliparus rotundus (strain ATCC BAA-972 / CDC 1076 / CIP 108378 / DSM 44985 / JCM 13578) TaxID=640132 RepID=D6ZCH6_SEGRD|nr:malate dehydrogenase [Segniliparus rotundus]ADG97018.1 malate dehydrogenase [Segniliparus rotundus DSM 44985]
MPHDLPGKDQPVVVAVTGAAGNIGYSAVFQIASGAMLGPGRRIVLRLLETPAAARAAEGVAMELMDCAFGLLDSVEVHDDPAAAFAGANVALLVGAKPRARGMERSDLLRANGGIFGPQGRALNEGAADDIRVIVVGNPANTNALIALSHAPDIPPERFTALTRLDHNRALAQLAVKAGVRVGEVSRVSIWGNHSSTQYPDVFHARAGQLSGAQLAEDRSWLADEFIPTVAQRGAAIIEARGVSSAGSAATAAIDHIRDWALGREWGGDWTSVALPSPGVYGVPEGLVSSFPARSVNGEWLIVEGLHVGEFSRARIDASVAELVSERDAVRALGLL